ncbi:MAG: TetR/AcrR family transcriptional regulator [Candidatus Velamenicoccus archaeovorus]
MMQDTGEREMNPSTDPSEQVQSRPRREPLTRERVIRAALRVMDAEGLEAVTMRRVGREVGVEAMSLYNHVRDKEDLLDGITELVMSELEPPPESADWVEQARAAAHGWRRVLKSHPNVVRLLAERKHPMTSVTALKPMEYALDILRRAGLSEEGAVQALHSIGGYLFGFVMMEVGNLMAGNPSFGPAEDPDELLRLIPAEELPRFVELAPFLARCDMDATFDFGLELLLAGIRARTRRRTGASASPAPG